jgi:hypothetical protein
MTCHSMEQGLDLFYSESSTEVQHIRLLRQFQKTMANKSLANIGNHNLCTIPTYNPTGNKGRNLPADTDA